MDGWVDAQVELIMHREPWTIAIVWNNIHLY